MRLSRRLIPVVGVVLVGALILSGIVVAPKIAHAADIPGVCRVDPNSWCLTGTANVAGEGTVTEMMDVAQLGNTTQGEEADPSGLSATVDATNANQHLTVLVQDDGVPVTQDYGFNQDPYAPAASSDIFVNAPPGYQPNQTLAVHGNHYGYQVIHSYGGIDYVFQVRVGNSFYHLMVNATELRNAQVLRAVTELMRTLASLRAAANNLWTSRNIMYGATMLLAVAVLSIAVAGPLAGPIALSVGGLAIASAGFLVGQFSGGAVYTNQQAYEAYSLNAVTDFNTVTRMLNENFPLDSGDRGVAPLQAASPQWLGPPQVFRP